MLKAVALTTLALLVLSAVAYADPPSIRTRTTRHGTDRDTCLTNVESVMKQLGFRNLDVDKDDVEGSKGDYAAEVRCGRRSVQAIVAGPIDADAGELRDDIIERVKALRP